MKVKSYRNGNYIVSLFPDGTKVRRTKDDYFDAEFPENIDLKITNQCDKGCPMCHEKSVPTGSHSDIINEKFIDSLVPGTEVALGGGMVTKYPHLEQLLVRFKNRGVIANMTVHQEEFLDNIDFINHLIKEELIYGIGISLHNCNDEFINIVKNYPNAVIHTIAGITTLDDYNKMASNGLKILILGYKTFGRGSKFYETFQNTIDSKIQNLKNEILNLIPKFKVVSFDNLSLKQLEIQNQIESSVWEESYMGDDGQHTMYIDAVNRKFAKNSISEVRYDLLDDIKEMFNVVKGKRL